ncbi:hypothetical protein ROZALSC1DRAFT_29237 [Rozella allomycis CSF55]|uniref:Major facilitator superfamily (MFS) profile domain-containing protein n=1 Tax=Rozella allomycis (strain CSF55) TaxID=988480 RepID=A0A4P9YJ78_ROZAC|nr:hypothetical protein ROZALSC1DRAFT_29237 [Rozella allomycis CSF55]
MPSRTFRHDASIEDIKSEASPLLQQNRKSKLAGLRNADAKGQFYSKFYLFITLFMCLMMLRMNFYIGTISKQLNHLESAEDSKYLIEFFDLALPLGGVVAVPAIGYLLDKFQIHVSIYTVSTMATIFGIFK